MKTSKLFKIFATVAGLVIELQLNRWKDEFFNAFREKSTKNNVLYTLILSGINTVLLIAALYLLYMIKSSVT